MKSSLVLLVAALALGAAAGALGSGGPYGNAPSSSAIHLYGSGSDGWGTSPSTLANPGPTLQLAQGVAQAFVFYSTDTKQHLFFVDLNNNVNLDPGEPQGPSFSSSAGTEASITVDQAGQFIYRCRNHPTTMTGTVVVQAATPVQSPQPNPSPAPQPSPSSAAGGVNGMLLAVAGLVAVAAGAAAGAYLVRRRRMQRPVPSRPAVRRP